MLSRKTVFEHEMGLRFRSGKFLGTLGPGRYWLWSGSQQVLTQDTRPRAKIVGGQEVMTRDGGTLRATLVANYRVTDAKVYHAAGGGPAYLGPSRSALFAMTRVEPEGPADPEVQLHHRAQILLREWITTRSLQEALDERATLAGALAEPMAETARELGVTLDSLDLLDFTISGNLRAAHGDLLKAELEGRAALQRARNEAATMRSLINTARLVREHPGLLELRILTSGQKPRVHVTVNPREGTPSAAPLASDEEV